MHAGSIPLAMFVSFFDEDDSEGRPEKTELQNKTNSIPEITDRR